MALKFRLAVVCKATGACSSSWFAYQDKKGNVYVGRREFGHLQKVSLHEGPNRVCRYADTAEYAGGPRKPHIGWIRNETPTSGLEFALHIAFPTNYLEAPSGPMSDSVLRVDAAEPGNAAVIGIFFSKEKPQQIMAQIGTAGRLFSHSPAPTGEFSGFVSYAASDWQDMDVIVPASYDQQQEYRFTAQIPEGTRRTSSLVVPWGPVTDGSLCLVERHGYMVAPGTPYVTLTNELITLSRSVAPKIWRRPEP